VWAKEWAARGIWAQPIARKLKQSRARRGERREEIRPLWAAYRIHRERVPTLWTNKITWNQVTWQMGRLHDGTWGARTWSPGDLISWLVPEWRASPVGGDGWHRRWFKWEIRGRSERPLPQFCTHTSVLLLQRLDWSVARINTITYTSLKIGSLHVATYTWMYTYVWTIGQVGHGCLNSALWI
jgi:hypothetical protein